MSFNLLDYVFDPASVQQDENFPFIGDQFEATTKKFHFTKHKNISVASIKVENDIMDISVILSNIHHIKMFNDIVVGVKAIYRDKRRSQSLTVRWRVSNLTMGHADIYPVPVNKKVLPGPATLIECSVQRRHIFACNPTKSGLDLEFISLKRFLMCVRKAERTWKGNAKKETLTSLEKIMGEIDEISLELKNHVENYVSSVDSESWIFISFFLVNQFWTLQNSMSDSERRLRQIQDIYEDKIEMIRKLKERGVDYVDSDEKWKTMASGYSMIVAILLFEESLTSINKTLEMFFELKSEYNDTMFCFVDMDMVAYTETLGSKPNKTVIRAYKDGKCDNEDLMDEMKKSQQNVVECPFKKKNQVPKARAFLKLQCPGHSRGSCPKTIRDWLCKRCRSKLYYSFNNDIYCELCGYAPIRECKFRCKRNDHDEFDSITDSLIESLKSIVPLEEKNILILGQSGVGKSTWINSTVNYLLFDTLEKAQYEEVIAPIPMKFLIVDSNFESKVIKVGDFNEETDPGASVTKECNTYSMLYENKIINLIDTPGVGDNRGVNEDVKNIKKMLNYLQHVEFLHGICVLLKPNETRLSALLTYCLSTILNNLHRSSNNNLLFCFTNARSTFYKPGETIPILRNLLEEIGVELDLKERTFCLDNEAFKFLCCKDAVGISFSEKEYNDFSLSWRNSVKETYRLLEKVSSLEALKTNDTLSLNRARRIIITLTRPLGDLAEIIEANIDQYIRAIDNVKYKLKNLKHFNSTPQLKLIAEELDHPAIVCFAEKCVSKHRFSKTVKQKAESFKCYSPCDLEYAIAESYPNFEFQKCNSFNGKGNCNKCSCSAEFHMYITHDQRVVEVEINDPQLESIIETYGKRPDLSNNLLTHLEKKKKEHEDEKYKILNICVVFTKFLRSSAIAEYDDIIGNYLHFLEKCACQNSGKKNRIKKLIDLYRKIEAFDNMGHNVEDIAECENELFNLPIYGEQLKQVMAVAVAAEDNIARCKTKVVSSEPKKRKILWGLWPFNGYKGV